MKCLLYINPNKPFKKNQIKRVWMTKNSTSHRSWTRRRKGYLAHWTKSQVVLRILKNIDIIIIAIRAIKVHHLSSNLHLMIVSIIKKIRINKIWCKALKTGSVKSITTVAATKTSSREGKVFNSKKYCQLIHKVKFIHLYGMLQKNRKILRYLKNLKIICLAQNLRNMIQWEHRSSTDHLNLTSKI
jgi:hypothetical protein